MWKWQRLAQALKGLGWQSLYPNTPRKCRLINRWQSLFVDKAEVVINATAAEQMGRDTIIVPVHYFWGVAHNLEVERAALPAAVARAIDALALFPLGRVLYTPGVVNLLTGSQIFSLLARHLRGDWSEMDADDQRENALALHTGERIFSAYTVRSMGQDRRVWVITEADRSATTVLLPEEY